MFLFPFPDCDKVTYVLKYHVIAAVELYNLVLNAKITYWLSNCLGVQSNWLCCPSSLPTVYPFSMQSHLLLSAEIKENVGSTHAYDQ